MVGLLLIVVVCMNLAADPGMWTWLFPASPPETAQQDQQQEEKKSKEIDRSIKFDEESPLAPDAFRSKPEDANKPAHRPAVAEASPDRLGETLTSDGRGKTAPHEHYDVELDPKLLESVSDDWLGIRRSEAPAFYAILAKARELPLKMLEEAGDNRVDYTVLMTDSEQYRGMPLTVEGTIRQIDRVTVSGEEVEQDYGIEHYYVAWMFTASSGNSPYRLIAADLPEDMPRGENLEVPAKFTGYFFKRQGYRSQGGFHKAPVLIGQSLRWNRPPAVAPELAQDSGLAPYAIALAVLVALGLGVLIWRFNVSDKQFAQKHVDHFTTATPEAIRDLENLETSDPADHFRRMQEDAIEEELNGEE